MKIVGKKMAQIEPCEFVKKSGIILATPGKKGYLASNVAKVVSEGEYTGSFVVYLRNRVKTFNVDGTGIKCVPYRDIIAEVEPDDNQDVIFEKDMIKYRTMDDKVL